MQIILYGIKNCDTMKRAFSWLTARQFSYRFHDYKSGGIDADRLGRWCAQTGWQALLNTRGTTWRRLSPEDQADMDESKAIALMMTHPSLIKRPVMEAGERLLIGFSPEQYEELR